MIAHDKSSGSGLKRSAGPTQRSTACSSPRRCEGWSSHRSRGASTGANPAPIKVPVPEWVLAARTTFGSASAGWPSPLPTESRFVQPPPRSAQKSSRSLGGVVAFGDFGFAVVGVFDPDPRVIGDLGDGVADAFAGRGPAASRTQGQALSAIGDRRSNPKAPFMW